MMKRFIIKNIKHHFSSFVIHSLIPIFFPKFIFIFILFLLF